VRGDYQFSCFHKRPNGYDDYQKNGWKIRNLASPIWIRILEKTNPSYFVKKIFCSGYYSDYRDFPHRE
jgi:hypothetical protein